MTSPTSTDLDALLGTPGRDPLRPPGNGPAAPPAGRQAQADLSRIERQLADLAGEQEIDEETLERAKRAGEVAKALAQVSDADNKQLVNYLNSGRFVDVLEAELLIAKVLERWVSEGLRVMAAMAPDLADKHGVELSSARALLTDAATAALAVGEELQAAVTTQAEQLMRQAAAKRGSKGSGTHRRPASTSLFRQGG